MYKYILVLSLFFTLLSCNNNSQKETQITETESAAVNLAELPEMSIYHLPSTWTTQDNQEIELSDLQGETLVVVMIYTTCQAACPRLVADMRHIQRDVPENLDQKVKYLFVSIDPETDTPEKLKEFAIENQMTDDKWLFLRGTEDNTREFAAVLAMTYKAISPFDFSHSNIISVFNPLGELTFQREGLGVTNDGVINAIVEASK